jgi:biopolymer transport protein ExbD
MGLHVGSHSRQPRINVTPLVDIVLVLLIIFIVLVPGMVRAAKIALPSKDPGVPSEPLVVTLEASGAWRLQATETTPAALVEALAGAVQLQPMFNRKVFLKVHPSLPHHRVVAALDAIRQAGERAKRETLAKPVWLKQHGGDIRVVTGLLKEG